MNNNQLVSFSDAGSGLNSPSTSTRLMTDDEYLNTMIPVGYRFKPHDYELVHHYLKRKISAKPLPPNRINEAHVYNCSPDQLTSKPENISITDGTTKEWYFFSCRDKKYLKGNRPDRGAGKGYWKASSKDTKVYDQQGRQVGCKKALAYYELEDAKDKKGKRIRGSPRDPGTKTCWLMHEFTLLNSPPQLWTPGNKMRLDEVVLCRIYKSSRTNNREEEQSENYERTNISSTVTQTESPDVGNYSSPFSILTEYPDLGRYSSPFPTLAESPYVGNYSSQFQNTGNYMGMGSSSSSYHPPPPPPSPPLNHHQQQQRQLMFSEDNSLEGSSYPFSSTFNPAPAPAPAPAPMCPLYNNNQITGNNMLMQNQFQMRQLPAVNPLAFGVPVQSGQPIRENANFW